MIRFSPLGFVQNQRDEGFGQHAETGYFRKRSGRESSENVTLELVHIAAPFAVIVENNYLRETIVNRACVTRKNLYFPVFTDKSWSCLLWPPVNTNSAKKQVELLYKLNVVLRYKAQGRVVSEVSGPGVIGPAWHLRVSSRDRGRSKKKKSVAL